MAPEKGPLFIHHIRGCFPSNHQRHCFRSAPNICGRIRGLTQSVWPQPAGKGREDWAGCFVHTSKQSLCPHIKAIALSFLCPPSTSPSLRLRPGAVSPFNQDVEYSATLPLAESQGVIPTINVVQVTRQTTSSGTCASVQHHRPELNGKLSHTLSCLSLTVQSVWLDKGLGYNQSLFLFFWFHHFALLYT